MTPDGLEPFRVEAARQALWCGRLNSPFTARLCEVLAARVRAGTPLGARLAAWPGDMIADVIALRLCGGLHARVLAGADDALAALYPPAALPSANALAAAVGPLLDGEALLGALDSAPQTNEVGRSGVLMPGMMAVALETGLPLRLLELGASAGLNLVLDRYGYRLGGREVGDASGLVLAPAWEGPPPGGEFPRVGERLGVDLNPLDVGDEGQRLRMLSYVWPDQAERLARMRAATAIAAADPPVIVREDAATFVEREARVRPGVATLVFHSVAFQYFPAETQARIAAHMAAEGARATAEALLAWLRYEMDDPQVAEPPTLRLRVWPGTDRLLAVAHPHGASVRWMA